MQQFKNADTATVSKKLIVHPKRKKKSLAVLNPSRELGSLAMF
jgi:hypothetical protein